MLSFDARHLISALALSFDAGRLIPVRLMMIARSRCRLMIDRTRCQDDAPPAQRSRLIRASRSTALYHVLYYVSASASDNADATFFTFSAGAKS